MARGRGLTPMFTHYHREGKKGDQVYRVLGATTCILLMEDGRVASRGATVVSRTDTPTKLEGRGRSLKRALRAALAESAHYLQLRAEDENFEIPTKKVKGLSKRIEKFIKLPYDVELTEVELSRIDKARERKLHEGKAIKVEPIATGGLASMGA